MIPLSTLGTGQTSLDHSVTATETPVHRAHIVSRWSLLEVRLVCFTYRKNCPSHENSLWTKKLPARTLFAWQLFFCTSVSGFRRWKISSAQTKTKIASALPLLLFPVNGAVFLSVFVYVPSPRVFVCNEQPGRTKRCKRVLSARLRFNEFLTSHP